MASRDNLVGGLGLAMQRYQRSVQAFDDAVGRRLGLGPADLRCLDWLADGPKSAGQLRIATALTPAATTRSWIGWRARVWSSGTAATRTADRSWSG